MATMKAPAPKAKKKARPMGMRSTAPRMQGPISGGAGGGFTQQPGPGMSAPPQAAQLPFMAGGAPTRGPMPLPPSAAQRPAPPMMAPPMMPGGPMAGQLPFNPGGGGFQRPQSPTGPPMGPPPMMGGGFGGPPRGIPPGAGGMGRFGAGPNMMGSIGPPPVEGAGAPVAPGDGIPINPQRTDFSGLPASAALQRAKAARMGGGQPQF